MAKNVRFSCLNLKLMSPCQNLLNIFFLCNWNLHYRGPIYFSRILDWLIVSTNIELKIFRMKCAYLDFTQFKSVYFESIDSSSAADIYKIFQQYIFHPWCLHPVRVVGSIYRRYYYIHGGAKIWILSSSGENNISRMSAANEWNIVFTTRR